MDSYVPNHWITTGSLTKEAAQAAGEAAENNGATAPGDSGGPIVAADMTMSGVVYGGHLDVWDWSMRVSHYVDIHQPKIRALIDQANDDGAGIVIPAGWEAIPQGDGTPSKYSGWGGSMDDLSFITRHH